MAISDNVVALRDYVRASDSTADAESAGYALQAEIDAQPDPKTTLIDYSGLDFKQMLAACPIDGIDLTREPEYPREVEL
jgi:hypothetical protein